MPPCSAAGKGAGLFAAGPPGRYTPAHRILVTRLAMSRANLLRQRLLVLFLAALFAFFSPLAARFEAVPDAWGIPALYLYLFGVWALVIAAAGWICSRGRD